jgi:hypothetical protein
MPDTPLLEQSLVLLQHASNGCALAAELLRAFLRDGFNPIAAEIAAVCLEEGVEQHRIALALFERERLIDVTPDGAKPTWLN